MKTLKDIQITYIDTPGLYFGKQRMTNRYMNRTVHGALRDANVILFIIESYWKIQDFFILNNLEKLRSLFFLSLIK